MKKLFTVLFLTVAAISFAASDAFAQLGVEVGYSNSNYLVYSDDDKDGELMSGLHLGLTYDIRLIGGLSLQPGITYSYLTDSDVEKEFGFTARFRNSEHYLNVPLRVQYSFDVLPVLSLKVFTGPTFSFGMAGYYDYRINGEILGNQINGSLKYDYFSGKISSDGLSKEVVDMINSNLPDAVYNRFDVLYGLGVGIGIFDSFEVRAGYDFGLTGRLKGDDVRNNPKRNYFYLTIGYRF